MTAQNRMTTANLLLGALNFHPDVVQQIADQLLKIKQQQKAQVSATHKQNKLQQQQIFTQQPTHQSNNHSPMQQPHSNKMRRR